MFQMSSLRPKVDQLLADFEFRLQQSGRLSNVLAQLEQKTGAKQLHIAGGLIAVYSLCLMFGRGAQLLCNLACFLYPAFASLNAIGSSSSNEYARWLLYWMVFALFNICEFFTPIVPFYWLLKAIFFYWLNVSGVQLIYARIMRRHYFRHNNSENVAMTQNSREHNDSNNNNVKAVPSPAATAPEPEPIPIVEWTRVESPKTEAPREVVQPPTEPEPRVEDPLLKEQPKVEWSKAEPPKPVPPKEEEAPPAEDDAQKAVEAEASEDAQMGVESAESLLQIGTEEAQKEVPPAEPVHAVEEPAHVEVFAANEQLPPVKEVSPKAEEPPKQGEPNETTDELEQPKAEELVGIETFPLAEEVVIEEQKAEVPPPEPQQEEAPQEKEPRADLSSDEVPRQTEDPMVKQPNEQETVVVEQPLKEPEPEPEVLLAVQPLLAAQPVAADDPPPAEAPPQIGDLQPVAMPVEAVNEEPPVSEEKAVEEPPKEAEEPREAAAAEVDNPVTENTPVPTEMALPKKEEEEASNLGDDSFEILPSTNNTSPDIIIEQIPEDHEIVEMLQMEEKPPPEAAEEGNKQEDEVTIVADANEERPPAEEGQIRQSASLIEEAVLPEAELAEQQEDPANEKAAQTEVAHHLSQEEHHHVDSTIVVQDVKEAEVTVQQQSGPKQLVLSAGDPVVPATNEVPVDVPLQAAEVQQLVEEVLANAADTEAAPVEEAKEEPKEPAAEKPIMEEPKSEA